ncbi:M3 family oligoendopeptidase [Acidocella sp.]|uniref:M3 family oligoendopeptidase n=1 Tax=Acidocella sp. TaxID=50710 RepID=UPI0026295EDE|nr:M3 family oligoendopeptidase [Acidocella sp.]MDD2796027.1 M3 family oligoendopeptidase [Acidocella sp.]
MHPTQIARHPEGFSAPGGTLPAWNLGDLYAGLDDPRIAADLQSAQDAAAAFESRYKTRLAGLSGAELAAAVHEYERISESLGRAASFAQLLFSADSNNPAHGKFYQTISERVTLINTSLLFFTLELNLLPEADLAAKQQDPALARYAPWLRDLRVFLPHQLSAELEKLLMEKDVTGHAAWSRLFDETTAAMRVPVNGEDLTLSAALNKLSDAERATRQAAGKAVGEAMGRTEKLFALITNTLAKDKEIDDNWRHYPTPASYRNRANMVEDEVVEALTTAVKSSYARLAHRYYVMKAKWLGLDKLEYWDRNAPLPGDDDRAIPWPEAKEMVLAAYARFNPALAAQIEPFFERNWIDAAPRPGKSGGAFAHPTVPAAHPYVLMNYHGRTRDVMTLAHELGHGAHQRLAADQGYLMSGTPLTLAETASVFGEMLTFRSLLDAESDPQRRRLMLAGKVEDMLNTVVRQIAFYEFELKVHAERRTGELLPARIGEIWLEVQTESLGPAFTFAEEYRLFWAYVPHFIHSPFYVYAYAFGDCLVNALYAVYQESADKAAFAAKYTEMLKAGGTLRHKELLAPFGLDATHPAFWQKGLDVISGFIDELEA